MSKKIKEYKVSIGDIAQGIIYIYLDDTDKAYFRDISVSENIRGKGFGSMLLDFLEKTAIQLHCKSFILKVERRTKTYDWYKKRGYLDYSPNMEDNSFVWMKKEQISRSRKMICVRDKMKVCDLCHKCDINVLNPHY